MANKLCKHSIFVKLYVRRKGNRNQQMEFLFSIGRYHSQSVSQIECWIFALWPFCLFCFQVLFSLFFSVCVCRFVLFSSDLIFTGQVSYKIERTCANKSWKSSQSFIPVLTWLKNGHQKSLNILYDASSPSKTPANNKYQNEQRNKKNSIYASNQSYFLWKDKMNVKKMSR